MHQPPVRLEVVIFHKGFQSWGSHLAPFVRYNRITIAVTLKNLLNPKFKYTTIKNCILVLHVNHLDIFLLLENSFSMVANRTRPPLLQVFVGMSGLNTRLRLPLEKSHPQQFCQLEYQPESHSVLMFVLLLLLLWFLITRFISEKLARLYITYLLRLQALTHPGILNQTKTACENPRSKWQALFWPWGRSLWRKGSLLRSLLGPNLV